MRFNIKQLYTIPLEIHELKDDTLIIDTETVGTGTAIEIIEIALGDTRGQILYESLVQPVFNRLPVPSKHIRFEKSEFKGAPVWTEIWPAVSSLIDRKLLVAYNAAFDRRAIAATCSRYQQTSSEKGWRCAMQLIKSIVNARRALTLEEACARYGLPGGNHRAGRDVQATAELLKAISAAAS
jgi:DNA polymerase III epsilon subunit-like protein